MHGPLQRKIVLGVVGVSLLMVAGVAATLRTHDYDMTVYSETPEGKLQVIGLRERFYLLDYGGQRDIVLFSTMSSSGVTTYGRKEDIYPGYPEDRKRRHEGQKNKAVADSP